MTRDELITRILELGKRVYGTEAISLLPDRILANGIERMQIVEPTARPLDSLYQGLMLLALKNGVEAPHPYIDPDTCGHDFVEFDEEAARGLGAYEVRKHWPRGTVCPHCGATGIFYASWLHYMAGDW